MHSAILPDFAHKVRAYAVGLGILTLLATVPVGPFGAVVAAEQEGKEAFDPFSRLSQKDWVAPDKFEKKPPSLLSDRDMQGGAQPESGTQAPQSAAAPADKQSVAVSASEQQQQGAAKPEPEQFGIEVSSTAENMKLPIPLPPANAKEQARRYEPGWMESAASARRQAFIESSKGWSPYRGAQPATLRLSFLPGKVPALTRPEDQAPQDAAADKSGKSAKNARSAAQQAPKADPQAPDLESWTKAIKDYKTKQVEAIQSDRQTLEALQNAIKELGLQKELNFDSSMLLSPPKQEAPSRNAKAGGTRGAP